MLENKNGKDSKQKESYGLKVLGFYFAPQIRSFFTVLYLIFFTYFIIFYFDNLTLAAKFILYTVSNSTIALGLGHLFWGSFFVIALILPFSVSFYAIFIPYEIKIRPWETAKKILLIILVFLATVDAVIVLDYMIRYIEGQTPIKVFMEKMRIELKK